MDNTVQSSVDKIYKSLLNGYKIGVSNGESGKVDLVLSMVNGLFIIYQF
jgi:hypothetical protein